MCEKRISTESGVLQCDLPGGHAGMHHADHEGGMIRDPYERKSTQPTAYSDDRGNFIMGVIVPPIHIEWPQEGMNEGVRIARAHRE